MVFWLVASQLHFFFCGFFIIFAYLSVSTLLIYMSHWDVKGITPLPEAFRTNIFPSSSFAFVPAVPTVRNALRPDVL